ncbi:ATP-dependent DNA helicase RecQ [Flagellimonas halotolerans]|uniref:ATP-dependent DNA helicase RecQ n=1 Tax=Flagellimonas halotolerans TaxID=3112164 RepID=A0ABU6IUU5_9FLAO|nr:MULTISPECIES: ATP-dependent DNA helicase RecQ [unclassified Allomuricauda]MEC3966876.1 ATP-dependent DNA helicase RecQ [Muricauda sp. SYSU M86414]MEC4266718.1 ATP-dependent DNA helicase RecQ [Muricauda sp. SYSU M84420]
MHKDTTSILKKFWGYDDFRGPQKEIIDNVLSGKDVLALMPTGGGKSICYQVPSLAMEGICIVISPLVALIQDQVAQLKKRNIKAVALTGGIPPDELNDLLDNCLYGNYKFLYLSPERLQQPIVQERIPQMNINLIAIDEAHCISQWGNDFRPAYLECAILKELVPNKPIIALTATATPRVVNDIVENLELENVVIFKDSFSRSNINFRVKRSEDKLYQLKKYMAKVPGSAIVYVRSRKMSISLVNFLVKNGISASFFHGGIPKSDKEEKLNLWLSFKVRAMVATNAFGMGVDKPDVRLVVHYHIPDSLESYFQEAGRAGRDGKPSTAIILTSKEDKDKAKQQFLSTLPDVAFVKKVYSKLNNYFQISYGELVSEPLAFEFNAFCKRYEFNPNLTFNAIRILDQNSVLSLAENFKEKTTLQFVASKSGIFEYLDKNRKTAPIIQTILRTYGGITEYDTKINLYMLSKKTGASEEYLKKILQQLADDGIVEYQNNTSDLEVTFLVPREDDHTINLFAKKIKDFNQVKQNNMAAMLGYVSNKKVCRNIYLLNYFGEKTAEKCGTCDICTKKEKVASPYDLEKRIMELLEIRPHSSRQLEKAIGANEKELLKTLERLLEDELVSLNFKNEYIKK